MNWLWHMEFQFESCHTRFPRAGIQVDLTTVKSYDYLCIEFAISNLKDSALQWIRSIMVDQPQIMQTWTWKIFKHHFLHQMCGDPKEEMRKAQKELHALSQKGMRSFNDYNDYILKFTELVPAHRYKRKPPAAPRLQFLVQWKGYPQPTWEESGDVTEEAVNEYYSENKMESLPLTTS